MSVKGVLSSLPQNFASTPPASRNNNSGSRNQTLVNNINANTKLRPEPEEEMSSEEVEKLAQAIHNHADVLYESWRKGQEAFNMKRMEDTLELLADPGLTPKLEHLVSTFVRRDKAKRQQFQQLSPTEDDSHSPRRESSPIGSNNPRKPLPKSILAVVQRFEPKQQSPPSSQTSPKNIGQEIPLIHSPRERSPAATANSGFNIPGVGPVTKNLVWTETINKHSSSERVGDRGSPIPTPVNIKTYLDSGITSTQNQQTTNGSNGITKTLISPTTGKIVRERTIPIERPGDPSSSNNARNLQSASTPLSNARGFSPGRIILVDVNANSPNYNSALEQEEEKLLRALQNNQVVAPPKYSPNNIGSSIPPRENRHHYDHTPNNHHSSRIAFAKERIRQSQEHPLTQQRLELQKRLPSPNGNLAAAIALQQGKLKFQPNGRSHSHSSLDEPDMVNGHHNSQSSNGKSSFVRFGPGATVADRVQLFEKYPTPPLGGGHHGSKSPSPARSLGHVITHPIHIIQQHSNEQQQREPLHSQQMHGVHHHDGHLKPSSNNYLQSTNVSVNSNAPWRTSPARDVGGPNLLVSQHNLQHSDLPDIPTQVRKSVTSSVPSSLINNKHIKDKARLVAKSVPRFFWPEGKPMSNTIVQQFLSKAEEKLKEENNCVNYEQFGEVISASGIPLYWKRPFWMALGLLPDGVCTSQIFLPFLRYLLTDCPDESARFLRIFSSASRNFPGGYDKNNYANNNVSMNAKYYNNHGDYCQDLKFVELSMSDFVPMIQDIIDTHPGLGFLRDAPEFHSRYITTVISRIFYKVNRSWSGRLTLTELRRSNLHKVIKRLEEETDINTITEYFSYEHFYVIYCKFWELDKDHDLLIDKHDLAAHAEHSLSSRIIERIFSGTVIRGWDVATPTRAGSDKMTYSDFVWFLLSEEDKKTPTAIEYWFRCLDLDGDGVISPYELQFFYSEQEARIETYGIEPLHFSNVYCQIVDMLHCSPTGIRLKDLKKNPHLAANVFNTVFNLEKYLEHEQRDPFAASASVGNPENAEGVSDWDKFAAGEYELLIAEESPGDHLHDSGLDEVLTP